MPRLPETFANRQVPSEVEPDTQASHVAEAFMLGKIASSIAKADAINSGHKKACRCPTCVSRVARDLNEWTEFQHKGNQANVFERQGKKVVWKQKEGAEGARQYDTD